MDPKATEKYKQEISSKIQSTETTTEVVGDGSGTLNKSVGDGAAMPLAVENTERFGKRCCRIF